MIDLYQMPASSPCRAVLMTCKHIGLDVNLKFVNLMEGEQLKEEYLKMNPQHSIPTIDDNGFYLWESRAIMTYLADQYASGSHLYPKNPKKRALVDKFLYFDIGTLYKTMGEFVYPQIFKGEAPNKEKEEAFKQSLSYLNADLQANKYVTGEQLTLADFSILSSLTFAQLVDFDYSWFSHVQAWMDKLKEELPYYKEVNEKPINEFKAYLQAAK